MRSLDLTSVGLYDIVLSTYGTVAADLARNRGLLNQIHWYRIVLDEGEHTRYNLVFTEIWSQQFVNQATQLM